ncbi:MAG: stress protein [Actinomycetia bacterium]|nr:stress protein [Actinomycetes bacterium]
MIRHIVLLTFADTATDAQIQAVEDGLSALPARLSQLQAYVIGRDLGLGEGNATFAVTADFATVDDYIVYRDDPEHRRVITECIRPILAGRTAAQYEI